MLAHRCYSSTDLIHHGALFISSSWASLGGKIFWGKQDQAKKILFSCRSPDVSVTYSWICKGFSWQGYITYMGEEKGPSWTNSNANKGQFFTISEVQCLSVSWHLESWQLKSESRVRGLQHNIVHLSLLHLAAFKDFLFMATRNDKRIWSTEIPLSTWWDLAWLGQLQPVIFSTWINLFHLFLSCPLKNFLQVPFKTLFPIMQTARQRFPHAFRFLSLVSVSCLQAALLPSQKQMLFLKDAAALITGLPFTGRFPRTR